MESVDFETAFTLFCQEKLPGSDLPLKTWNDMKLKDMAGKGGCMDMHIRTLIFRGLNGELYFVVLWLEARTANFCTQTPALS